LRQPRQFLALFISLLLSLQTHAQSSTGGAAAAGVAAGAALAGGASQGSNSSSTAGASGAPIEMNIMVYGGLKQIALKIAADVDSVAKTQPDTHWQTVPSALGESKPCNAKLDRQILLEDSTSAAQISIYATWYAYQHSLNDIFAGAQAAIKKDIDDIKKILSDEEEAKRQAQQKKDEATKEIPPPQSKERDYGIFTRKMQSLDKQLTEATPSSTPSSSGGTGAATTTPPMALTYLGDITTALGAAKSGMSYAASSLQPATQALTTELGKDLCDKGIALYTSNSSVSVKTATDAVVGVWTSLAKANAAIQASPYTIPPAATDPDKPAVQQLSSDITSKVSTSNQMMTAFQSWMSSSDGNGNLILTDVIRGMTLHEALGDGVLALQFTIDAAGGNTRTNSFFLLNLFYTPKPSFNGGVVVTYELRSDKNQYIAGDTLKVLYNYTKWGPKSFLMQANGEVDNTSLGTGRP
jgi:hypothetical protein